MNEKSGNNFILIAFHIKQKIVFIQNCIYLKRLQLQFPNLMYEKEIVKINCLNCQSI